MSTLRTFRRFLEETLAPSSGVTLTGIGETTIPAIVERQHQVRLLTLRDTHERTGQHVLRGRGHSLFFPTSQEGQGPGWLRREAAGATSATNAEDVMRMLAQIGVDHDPFPKGWSNNDTKLATARFDDMEVVFAIQLADARRVNMHPINFGSAEAEEAARATCGYPVLKPVRTLRLDNGDHGFMIRGGERGMEQLRSLVQDLATLITSEREEEDSLLCGEGSDLLLDKKDRMHLEIIPERIGLMGSTRSAFSGPIVHAMQFMAAHMRPWSAAAAEPSGIKPMALGDHQVIVVRSEGPSASRTLQAAKRPAAKQARQRLVAFMEEACTPEEIVGPIKGIGPTNGKTP